MGGFFLVAWPPLAFLLVLTAASLYAARQGAASSEAVGTFVETRLSMLLATTLTIVGIALGLLVLVWPEAGPLLAAALQAGSWQGVGVGAAVGAAIAAVYFGGLERGVQWMQTHLGDYVPAGSTNVLGSAGGAFFLANVVLAPLVEEAWYRGLLFDLLSSSFSPGVALIVGSAAFGLFHWPGGVWYMVITGGLVGSACWGLRIWDGGLWAPYMAHLTLNVIEYAVLRRRARESATRP
ncbi:MAG: CPBP family intramembrane glutamic endopeptidase [Bacteroidota bacterium]